MPRQGLKQHHDTSRASEDKHGAVMDHLKTEDSNRGKVEVKKMQKTVKSDRKRILITGFNSLVGHSLYEQMRNDYLLINSGKKPHKFAGTFIAKDAETVPMPADTVKQLDPRKKPKTFGRNVFKSDIVIVDLLSGGDFQEAEDIIQILRHPPTEQHQKKQVLIVISSVFTWACTPARQDNQALQDTEFMRRVPLPKYQQMKQIENLAMTAQKFNSNLKVHIVCSGLPFGNGEANNVFYEFFRRAWLSLHPDLASLPVIGEGNNCIPTIHVIDLARFVKTLAMDSNKKYKKQYMFAVDECKSSTQAEIIQAISSSLGSGNVKKVQLADVIEEEWSEMMTLDLKLQVSTEFKEMSGDWHCNQGITNDTMKKLNDEFNHFRGLFPLKVYVGGPPSVGKSYFTSILADSYGIPHLKIGDIIENAKKLSNEMGDEVRNKIEELKDIEVEKYEKTRKKKDPDLDRAKIVVRFPDELVNKLVKSHISQPACLNKGFILDGYPRNFSNAQEIFLEPCQEQEEEKMEEETKQTESQNPFPGFTVNQLIVPQYSVILEADNDSLKQRIKELPHDQVEGTNQTEQHLNRRLNEYRIQNQSVQAETHIHNFFQKLIGPDHCLLIDNFKEVQFTEDTINKMRNKLEQNGKPCCLNLITDADKKFLHSIEKQAKREDVAKKLSIDNIDLEAIAQQKNIDLNTLSEEQKHQLAEEEYQRQLEAAVSASDEDEVDALIEKEEQEAKRNEEEAKAKKLADEQQSAERAQKEIQEAKKLEAVREKERDLLDKRSQPIRQYLMDNVVPHLTEGLITLCKDIPEDPTDFLANFLLNRADEIDQALIKQREDEIKRKAAEKAALAASQVSK